MIEAGGTGAGPVGVVGPPDLLHAVNIVTKVTVIVSHIAGFMNRLLTTEAEFSRRTCNRL
jgi:hypothetical protein